MEGKTLEAAASAAGMSERTARQWQQGPLPSATKVPRGWRTREVPFEAVWVTVVEPLLLADTEGKLEAKTVLEELVRRQPEDFAVRHLRTLQRRVRLGRAEHGPVKEVYFPQEHVPGRLGAIDFTHASELRVTILGSLFRHLFFELVLAFSGLRFVQLAFGETFGALLSGLQAALWHAGGVPEVVRLDNLSAATHQLKKTGGRALTKRFADVAAHYGFTASRIRPGEGHENGVVEKGHDVLKGALEQALLLRGSRDFASVEAYLVFVGDIVERKLHAGRADRVAIERAALGRLPATRLSESTRVQAVVRKSSTVHLGGRTYSVPSRLIGHVIDARVFADVVTVHLPGVDKPLETMPRLRGETHHRIDYRHVIWSLVRKPGAFAAYRYREDLFPSLVFRRAFDALRAARGDRADVEYVRILHLAASTTEHVVEAALATLLEKATPFDYVAVKAIAQPEQPALPRSAHRLARSRPQRCAARRRRGIGTAPYVPVMGDRITELLTTWKLIAAATELVPRLATGGHDEALALLLEVFEIEASARGQRRVDRLRKAAKLPPAKTFDTLDRARVPRHVLLKAQDLARGSFFDDAGNVLFFGLPGVGKSHLACALGHALVDQGRSVLFTPTYQLVQSLLVARRDLTLPRTLRSLDVFDVIILDDLGYVQQTADEAEVLFTLMAERYERRSLIITSKLVFSEWGRIFKSPMTTAAAIDRLVHHAVIIEIDRDSIRAEEAKKRRKRVE